MISCDQSFHQSQHTRCYHVVHELILLTFFSLILLSLSTVVSVNSGLFVYRAVALEVSTVAPHTGEGLWIAGSATSLLQKQITRECTNVTWKTIHWSLDHVIITVNWQSHKNYCKIICRCF